MGPKVNLEEELIRRKWRQIQILNTWEVAPRKLSLILGKENRVNKNKCFPETKL